MKERILIYGPPKVGISTFLSKLPKAKFVELGNGLNHLKVEIAVAQNFDVLMEYINKRIKNTTDYSGCYLVLDHLLGLEQMLFEHVCRKHPLSPSPKEGNTSIETIPYGKGYVLALEFLSQLLEKLDVLIKRKGAGVIIAAHATRITQSTPFMENMTVYTPMISATRKIGARQEQTTFDILKVWMDAILFVEQKNFITGGFGKTDDYNQDERVIFTRRKPWFEAGSRLDLPETIPFNLEQFKPYLGLEEKNAEKSTT